ncbi:hypothetical protein C4D60_Mb07t15450 [Musa balbisiana]|uniref:Uncharacterized protein n=1 Tax=Musa balbisiana TaxID=52838 RepID=A0A4S8JI00_MUSBA|nr:hypothetical protein C4D60_Mb07t15450 [Musa balbisiana]
MKDNLKEHKKVGFCGAILILQTTVDLEVTKGGGTKKKFRLRLGGLRPQMATFACSFCNSNGRGWGAKEGRG